LQFAAAAAAGIGAASISQARSARIIFRALFDALCRASMPPPSLAASKSTGRFVMIKPISNHHSSRISLAEGNVCRRLCARSQK
jgi:hypothetical protein